MDKTKAINEFLARFETYVAERDLLMQKSNKWRGVPVLGWFMDMYYVEKRIRINKKYLGWLDSKQKSKKS